MLNNHQHLSYTIPAEKIDNWMKKQQYVSPADYNKIRLHFPTQAATLPPALAQKIQYITFSSINFILSELVSFVKKIQHEQSFTVVTETVSGKQVTTYLTLSEKQLEKQNSTCYILNIRNILNNTGKLTSCQIDLTMRKAINKPAHSGDLQTLFQGVSIQYSALSTEQLLRNQMVVAIEEDLYKLDHEERQTSPLLRQTFTDAVPNLLNALQTAHLTPPTQLEPALNLLDLMVSENYVHSRTLPFLSLIYLNELYTLSKIQETLGHRAPGSIQPLNKPPLLVGSFENSSEFYRHSDTSTYAAQNSPSQLSIIITTVENIIFSKPTDKKNLHRRIIGMLTQEKQKSSNDNDTPISRFTGLKEARIELHQALTTLQPQQLSWPRKIMHGLLRKRQEGPLTVPPSSTTFLENTAYTETHAFIDIEDRLYSYLKNIQKININLKNDFSKNKKSITWFIHTRCFLVRAKKAQNALTILQAIETFKKTDQTTAEKVHVLEAINTVLEKNKHTWFQSTNRFTEETVVTDSAGCKITLPSLEILSQLNTLQIREKTPRCLTPRTQPTEPRSGDSPPKTIPAAP